MARGIARAQEGLLARHGRPTPGDSALSRTLRREGMEREIFSDSDSPFHKVEKLIQLRESIAQEIGAEGLSMREMMASDRPLTAVQANALISYLSFDRKLSGEIVRQLSRVASSDLRRDPRQSLGLIRRLLSLEHLITPAEAAELEALTPHFREHLAEGHSHWTAHR